MNDEKQSRDDLRGKMEASWRFAGNGCEVEWKDIKEQAESEGEVRLVIFPASRIGMTDGRSVDVMIYGM